MMKLSQLTAASRLLTQPLSQPTIVQRTRCLSQLVGPSVGPCCYLRQNDFLGIRNGNKALQRASLLPIAFRNDFNATNYESFGIAAPFHSSASLFEPAKKKPDRTPWEARLTDRIKAAWRASPIQPFWKNNHFINRWFLERFGIKNKHFLSFVIGCLLFNIITTPYTLEITQVCALIMIWYLLKGKKFL